jgi:hypothetical protein
MIDVPALRLAQRTQASPLAAPPQIASRTPRHSQEIALSWT